MSDDTSEAATENEMLTATTDSTILYAELCKLVDENQKLERERDEARGELNALATSIQKSEYSDAKEFELLGSVAGVISQIDNMYAGVRQQRDEAREIAQQLINIASHCLGWHENANPETITEAIKRWNASTKK